MTTSVILTPSGSCQSVQRGVVARLRYRPELPPAVNRLTLTVAAGERLGIVGRSRQISPRDAPGCL